MVQTETKLQGLLDGLDCDLRTGRAHALVRYEGDFAVIVRKSGTRQVSWPDVVDGILQGYESVIACQLALLQALGELGFTNFGIEEIWLGVGVSPKQAATTVLESMNCWNVAIEETAASWRVNLSTDSEKPLPMMVAMLIPLIPQEVEYLEFTAQHTASGTHILCGPTLPWREYSSTPSSTDEHHIAFMRAQLQWKYNDSPWLSTQLVRRWTAVGAGSAIEDPLTATRKLRVLRDLATITGDNELIDALTGAIRYVRLGNNSQAESELTKLLEWSSAPIQNPDWWQNY